MCRISCSIFLAYWKRNLGGGGSFNALFSGALFEKFYKILKNRLLYLKISSSNLFHTSTHFSITASPALTFSWCHWLDLCMLVDGKSWSKNWVLEKKNQFIELRSVTDLPLTRASRLQSDNIIQWFVEFFHVFFSLLIRLQINKWPRA